MSWGNFTAAIHPTGILAILRFSKTGIHPTGILATLQVNQYHRLEWEDFRHINLEEEVLHRRSTLALRSTILGFMRLKANDTHRQHQRQA